MTTIIAALIGVAGTLIGAYFGYKGALNGIKEQIKYDNEKMQDTRDEEAQKAEDLIEYFLKDEICYNFDRLIYFNSEMKKVLVDAFSKNEIPSYNHFSDQHREGFRFDELNEIKYKYIEYLTNDIIDIYKMFKILGKIQELPKLTEKEGEFVINTYLKYYEQYTSY